MNSVIDWATHHARAMILLALLAFFGGVNAYNTLPREGAPDIDIPFLYVSAPYKGISAQDAEQLLAKPMETEFRAMEGLKELTTFSSDGHAGALLEFDVNFDKKTTLADLRELVDKAKAEFPDGAEDPEIFEQNFTQFPVITIVLFSTAPEGVLFRLANAMQKEIEALPQVLEANLKGYREEMLEVLIDQEQLDAYGVTVSELLQIVRANNQIVAAGELTSEQGAFPLKLAGSVGTLADVQAIAIKRDGDRVVTLGDIAFFRRTYEDESGTARHNGKKVVAIEVSKRVGENIIGTVAAIRKAAEETRGEWTDIERQTVSMDFAIDLSREVRDMNRQLEASVSTAVLLIITVLFLFLGVRAAFLVGLSIPLTFLLSFLLLGAFGMSVNNMVLFGMILAVGMLVDGSIVVAEYAERRLSEGVAPELAYSLAAKRMFWPIVTSTLTTLSAFMPMLFWPGIPGQFMRYLPITMIFVLSMSLAVALLFMPTLGGVLTAFFIRIGRRARALYAFVRHRPPPSGDEPERLSGDLTPAEYHPALRPLGPFAQFVHHVIGSPWRIAAQLLLLLFVLVVIGMQFGIRSKGVEFFVDTEPERVLIDVRARGNLSLEEKDRLVRQVEARLLDIEGIHSLFAFAGSGTALSIQGGGRSANDSIGSLFVELSSWENRPPGNDILKRIEARLADVPGVIVEVAQQEDGPPTGKPIQVELYSNDWPALLEAADSLSRFMQAVPEITDVEDTRPLPGIDWQLGVDREQAGRFGTNIATIGVLTQLVTNGVIIGSYRPDDSEEALDIRVRFPEDERDFSALNSLRVASGNGLAPLSLFVSREPVARLDDIRRRNNKRLLIVRADVQEGANVGVELDKIRSWIAQGNGQRGVDYVYGGERDDQDESEAFLKGAFVGALGLIFGILLAQFNSVYHAILVVSTTVTAVFGVLLGMMVMGQPFSIIMTGIGIVALAGVVVNNNIVLIDTYQELVREMPPLEAISRTVNRRFRPVMLTTGTTVAGLSPMMFAASIDFQKGALSIGAPAALWWVQLATAVIFGLAFSTILTLFLTPSMLAIPCWLNRGGAAFMRRISRGRMRM